MLMKINTASLIGATILAASLSASPSFAAQTMAEVLGDNVFSTLEKPSSSVSGDKSVKDFGAISIQFNHKSLDISDFTPPKVQAGCNGILIQGGSLSMLRDASQFVENVKNLMLGEIEAFGFKMALQALCSGCEQVMSSLDNLDRALNSAFKDRCTVYNAAMNGTNPFRDYVSNVDTALGNVKSAWHDADLFQDSVATEKDPNAGKKIMADSPEIDVKIRGSNVATTSRNTTICENLSASIGITEIECGAHLASLIGYPYMNADSKGGSTGDSNAQVGFAGDPTVIGRHIKLISGAVQYNSDDDAMRIKIPTCTSLEVLTDGLVSRNAYGCDGNGSKLVDMNIGSFAESINTKINLWLENESSRTAAAMAPGRTSFARLIPSKYLSCVVGQAKMRSNTTSLASSSSNKRLNPQTQGAAQVIRKVVLDNGDKYVAESYRIAVESLSKSFESENAIPMSQQQADNIKTLNLELQKLGFDDTTLFSIHQQIADGLSEVYDTSKCSRDLLEADPGT